MSSGSDHKADVQKLPFVIPKNTPDGDYLFRIEHLNVDSLQPLPYEPQAQLYISCAQVSFNPLLLTEDADVMM